MPGGALYDQAPLEPSFEEHGTKPVVSLVLIAILATSFNAHFSAGRIYSELEQATTRRFAMISGAGFALSWAIMVSVMMFGYLTFGGASQGYILNNYATNDLLANAARVGVFLSMLFSFPILCQAARDNLLELCTDSPTQGQKDATSIGIWLMTLVVALAMDDLGFVMAFSGAICGSATVYIFPAAMFLAQKPADARKWEGPMNWILVIFGVASGILGAMITVVQKVAPELLS
jgi:sodium-coupled neutral amino acid transporter 11